MGAANSVGGMSQAQTQNFNNENTEGVDGVTHTLADGAENNTLRVSVDDKGNVTIQREDDKGNKLGEPVTYTAEQAKNLSIDLGKGNDTVIVEGFSGDSSPNITFKGEGNVSVTALGQDTNANVKVEGENVELNLPGDESATGETEAEETPASGETEAEETPASGETEAEETPASGETEAEETPASGETEAEETPASGETEAEETPATGETEAEETPATGETEAEETPASGVWRAGEEEGSQVSNSTDHNGNPVETKILADGTQIETTTNKDTGAIHTVRLHADGKTLDTSDTDPVTGVTTGHIDYPDGADDNYTVTPDGNGGNTTHRDITYKDGRTEVVDTTPDGKTVQTITHPIAPGEAQAKVEIITTEANGFRDTNITHGNGDLEHSVYDPANGGTTTTDVTRGGDRPNEHSVTEHHGDNSSTTKTDITYFEVDENGERKLDENQNPIVASTETKETQQYEGGSSEATHEYPTRDEEGNIVEGQTTTTTTKTNPVVDGEGNLIGSDRTTTTESEGRHSVTQETLNPNGDVTHTATTTTETKDGETITTINEPNHEGGPRTTVTTEKEGKPPTRETVITEETPEGIKETTMTYDLEVGDDGAVNTVGQQTVVTLTPPAEEGAEPPEPVTLDPSEAAK